MVATVKKVSSNVTDPVADLLTRIRNANIAYKDETLAPVSKQARSILAILQEEGYIHGFEQEGEGVHQAFRVRLKYGPRKQRTITGIRRVSKPGRRIYRGRGEPAARDGRARGRAGVDVARRDDRPVGVQARDRRGDPRLRVVIEPG